jgi:hypothetical protein
VSPAEIRAKRVERSLELSVNDTNLGVVIDAALGEILTTCSKMDWLIDYGEYALRPERRRSNAMMFYKSSKVYYEPLGVVSAIVSWNYRASYPVSNIKLLMNSQRCTTLSRRFWLPCFLVTRLSSSVPNTSFGRQAGSSRPSDTVS